MAKYEEVMLSLRQGKYAQVYMLCGTEPYYIDKVSDWIEDNVLDAAAREFDQIVMYGKDLHPANSPLARQFCPQNCRILNRQRRIWTRNAPYQSTDISLFGFYRRIHFDVRNPDISSAIAFPDNAAGSAIALARYLTSHIHITHHTGDPIRTSIGKRPDQATDVARRRIIFHLYIDIDVMDIRLIYRVKNTAALRTIFAFELLRRTFLRLCRYLFAIR